MSSHSGPYVNNDNVVLHLDAANPKSFPGSGNIWYNIANTTIPNASPVSGFNPQCFWNSSGYFTINSNIDNPQPNAILTSTNSSHIYHSIPDPYRMGNSFQKRSYECWFRVTSLANTRDGSVFRTMVGTGCSHACNGGIEIIGQKIVGVHYNDTDGYRFEGSITPVEGQWYHAILTYDPDINPNKRFYVNGKLNATFQTVAWNYGGGAYEYEIGFNRKSNAPKTFAGDIAVVKMYVDRALTADEVFQNYTALKGRFNQ